MCAVSRQEIGVDIQKQTREYRRGIAKRFFHPDEYKYLKKNNFKDFFPVWTAKESYVKYTGRGVAEGFSTFSVVSFGRIAQSVNGAQIRFLSFDPDYCLYLCAEKIGEIKLYNEPFI